MSKEALDNHISLIDVTIKEAQAAVDMRDALLALQKNKHFTKIINEGYLVNEAAAKARTLASPALQNEQAQKEIMNALQGIGHLSQYFSVLIIRGNQAAKAIADNELYREQLLSGEIDLDELEE